MIRKLPLEETSEYIKLRNAWKKWNANCHLEDQIDWIEFLDERDIYV